MNSANPIISIKQHPPTTIQKFLVSVTNKRKIAINVPGGAKIKKAANNAITVFLNLLNNC